MSDSPFGGMPSGQAPWTPPAPVQKASRVPVAIAVVVSLLALGMAAAAFFKPRHDSAPATPQYSDQQVAEAKKNMCDAYSEMYKGIQGAGSLTSDDPNQKFMIAMNTRLAFNTAADYLTLVLQENPAAPFEVSHSARGLAAAYQRLVLARSAQAERPAVDSIGQEINESESALVQACK